MPRPALAQFDFFQSEVAVQDVYASIAAHGFRLAGPMMRNGNVYIADVIDRGRRRERLIIAARNGQIMQRFFVDVGNQQYRRPQRPDDDNFFTRLSRGFGGDDDQPPRPPLGLDGQDRPSEAVTPPPAPRRLARPKPVDIEPRVATRRDDAPITAAPLPLAPAPTPAPVNQPALVTAPSRPASAVASAPNPPAAATVPPSPSTPAASASRPTVVLTDPLRLPGDKLKEPAKAAAEAAVAKPTPKPATADVSVAPLE